MATKFSTLIMIIEEVTPDYIVYTSKTDIVGKDYTHLIPKSSMFPYEGLCEGHSYAMICVNVNYTWFWYIGYDLSDSVILKDNSLVI